MVSSLIVWEKSKVGHESCPCYGHFRLLQPRVPVGLRWSYNKMQTVCSSLGVSPWRAHRAPWVPRLLFICVTALLVSICPFIWNGSNLINKGKSNPQPWHMASVAGLNDWFTVCLVGQSQPEPALVFTSSSHTLVTHSSVCFLMTRKMSGIPFCQDWTLYICRMDTNSAKQKNLIFLGFF